jgi:hypothetical protein
MNRAKKSKCEPIIKRKRKEKGKPINEVDPRKLNADQFQAYQRWFRRDR